MNPKMSTTLVGPQKSTLSFANLVAYSNPSFVQHTLVLVSPLTLTVTSPDGTLVTAALTGASMLYQVEFIYLTGILHGLNRVRYGGISSSM